jgi:hypothetical protein
MTIDKYQRGVTCLELVGHSGISSCNTRDIRNVRHLTDLYHTLRSEYCSCTMIGVAPVVHFSCSEGENYLDGVKELVR